MMPDNQFHALTAYDPSSRPLRFLQAVHLWMILIFLFITQAVSANAQPHDYQLQPGDSLVLSMPGLSMQSWEATIDITGQVRFPFLGQMSAAGLTLTKLSKQMEIAATGMEVPVFEVGRKMFLSGDEIYLQVSRYRPVTVVGDVLQPGTIDFVPGLTVRAILGHAGGARLAVLNLANAPADAPVRLQSEIQTQKWLRAELLGSQILLEKSPTDLTITAERAAQLRALLGETEGNSAIAEIEIDLRARAHEREDLRERVNLTKTRVESLEQAYQNYEQASLYEEERLQRILTMDGRGLTTANRVTEVRNSALAASTRLLTVSSDIYEALAELHRLTEDLVQLDDSFHAGILDRKRRLDQQLAEVSARIDSLRLLLLTEVGSSEEDSVGTMKIVVHRGIGKDEVSKPAILGDVVYPGDIIEVILQIQQSN